VRSGAWPLLALWAQILERQPCKTISNTLMSKITTMGDKSKPATVGKKRRTGRNKGSTKLCNQ
jgi:hypothetical protein